MHQNSSISDSGTHDVLQNSKVIEAKVFGKGLVALTKTLELWCIEDLDYPENQELMPSAGAPPPPPRGRQGAEAALVSSGSSPVLFTSS